MSNFLCLSRFKLKSLFFKQQAKQGFTLIELLVVVLIIGILAAVALPQYTKSVDKSRYAQLVLIGNAVEKAQKIYFLENQAWPTDFEEIAISLPPGGTLNAAGDMVYDGKLVVMMRNNPDIFVSVSDPRLQASYLIYSAVSVRECRAWNQRAKNLCVANGGKFYTFENQMTVYRMP